jgi:hypothetical protein
MTQGIRLRQRALSSTGPEVIVKKTQNVVKTNYVGDSPAMKSCIDEVRNMKKDD